MTFSDEHRRNLRKLADHLASLPEDYIYFHIDTYWSSVVPRGQGYGELNGLSVVEEHPIDVLDNVSECGAVACAIGHGPIAGIPLNPDDLSWRAYAARVFGTHETGSRAGSYMFGCYGNSNNPQDAAERIRKVLDGTWEAAYYTPQYGY